MKRYKIERFIFLILLLVCGIALVISGLEAETMQAQIQELKRVNERKDAQLKDKQLQIEIQDMILSVQDELINSYTNEISTSLSKNVIK